MMHTETLNEQEQKLLEMIRTHSDPAKAFEIAITILIEFIKETNESRVLNQTRGS